MKFSVGYQLAEEGEEPFLDLVQDFREHVAEVYFPWLDMPSGRAPLATRRGYTDWTAQARLEQDLCALKEMGLALNVLFNANCYGSRAISQFLESQVVSVLEHLAKLLGGADSVTTTSPFVAHVVRKHFPSLEVRASVNMRIGTVQGMQYVSDLFDGYYVQKECNRDLEQLRTLKMWADAHGKSLHMLANSGCLAFCPGQTFHDNLVAHEQEVDEAQNVPGWVPHVCWRHVADRAHWPAVLQATWVRPEDLGHYEGLFPLVKLATRMHARPRAVLQAYTQRHWNGNLLDLLEPGFGPAFAPYALDNSRFPADWFDRTSACGRRCQTCDYCKRTLEAILVKAA